MDWNTSNMYLTTFGMQLNEDQNQLDRLGIVVSNKDKL
jgi:hypothetical protein